MKDRPSLCLPLCTSALPTKVYCQEDAIYLRHVLPQSRFELFQWLPHGSGTASLKRPRGSSYSLGVSSRDAKQLTQRVMGAT